MSSSSVAKPEMENMSQNEDKLKSKKRAAPQDEVQKDAQSETTEKPAKKQKQAPVLSEKALKRLLRKKMTTCGVIFSADLADIVQGYFSRVFNGISRIEFPGREDIIIVFGTNALREKAIEKDRDALNSAPSSSPNSITHYGLKECELKKNTTKNAGASVAIHPSIILADALKNFLPSYEGIDCLSKKSFTVVFDDSSCLEKVVAKGAVRAFGTSLTPCALWSEEAVVSQLKNEKLSIETVWLKIRNDEATKESLGVVFKADIGKMLQVFFHKIYAGVRRVSPGIFIKFKTQEALQAAVAQGPNIFEGRTRIPGCVVASNRPLHATIHFATTTILELLLQKQLPDLKIFSCTLESFAAIFKDNSIAQSVLSHGPYRYHFANIITPISAYMKNTFEELQPRKIIEKQAEEKLQQTTIIFETDVQLLLKAFFKSFCKFDFDQVKCFCNRTCITFSSKEAKDAAFAMGAIEAPTKEKWHLANWTNEQEANSAYLPCTKLQCFQMMTRKLMKATDLVACTFSHFALTLKAFGEAQMMLENGPIEIFGVTVTPKSLWDRAVFDALQTNGIDCKYTSFIPKDVEKTLRENCVIFKTRVNELLLRFFKRSLFDGVVKVSSSEKFCFLKFKSEEFCNAAVEKGKIKLDGGEVFVTKKNELTALLPSFSTFLIFLAIKDVLPVTKVQCESRLHFAASFKDASTANKILAQGAVHVFGVTISPVSMWKSKLYKVYLQHEDVKMVKLADDLPDDDADGLTLSKAKKAPK